MFGGDPKCCTIKYVDRYKLRPRAVTNKTVDKHGFCLSNRGEITFYVHFAHRYKFEAAWRKTGGELEDRGVAPCKMAHSFIICAYGYLITHHPQSLFGLTNQRKP